VALYSDALGYIAVTFVILCAVTGMSALTRFIEAIDKKLIIEAKPRQP
jgi:hypothetical protein